MHNTEQEGDSRWWFRRGGWSPGEVGVAISNKVLVAVTSTDEGEDLVSETCSGGVEVGMYVGT